MCKRHFACNGTVVEHPEYGEVIQFQGMCRLLGPFAQIAIQEINVITFRDSCARSNWRDRSKSRFTVSKRSMPMNQNRQNYYYHPNNIGPQYTVFSPRPIGTCGHLFRLLSQTYGQICLLFDRRFPVWSCFLEAQCSVYFVSMFLCRLFAISTPG